MAEGNGKGSGCGAWIALVVIGSIVFTVISQFPWIIGIGVIIFVVIVLVVNKEKIKEWARTKAEERRQEREIHKTEERSESFNNGSAPVNCEEITKSATNEDIRVTRGGEDGFSCAEEQKINERFRVFADSRKMQTDRETALEYLQQRRRSLRESGKNGEAKKLLDEIALAQDDRDAAERQKRANMWQFEPLPEIFTGSVRGVFREMYYKVGLYGSNAKVGIIEFFGKDDIGYLCFDDGSIFGFCARYALLFDKATGFIRLFRYEDFGESSGGSVGDCVSLNDESLVQYSLKGDKITFEVNGKTLFADFPLAASFLDTLKQYISHMSAPPLSTYVNDYISREEE